MKKLLPLLALAITCAAPPLRAQDYPLTADSKVQEGVPKGDILRFNFEKSAIFPGTSRSVSVYVPKQYDPAKPACVYVNQDGVQWNAPTVFDNLIARGEMPVTIGVFVTPGVVKAVSDNALPRFNRSLEYDGLGPDYANFLLNELLPFVETQKTADGRAIVLSKNGNDRAIGGSSSGAIAAFTAAWERPDAFSRVFSAIGTYVGLRGGNEYPTIIRKYEPKPLRVFLQDGSNDNNIYGGDWWIANQAMQRSFAFAGYEHQFVWGTGGHNGAHGTQVFPDAMRYLWKDWPQPVKSGLGAPQLKEILIPGEEWQAVGEGFDPIYNLVAQPQGKISFFGHMERGIPGFVWWNEAEKKFKMVSSESSALRGLTGVAGNSPSGVFSVARNGKIEALETPTKLLASFEDEPEAFVFKNDGFGYVATGKKRVQTKLNNLVGESIFPVAPQLFSVSPKGSKRLVDDSISHLSALMFSPDQTLLYAADANSHWVYSYQIQPDGTLSHKQKYYHLHVPDTADSAEARGMCVDRDGRLYVATALGIQVCDQAGRVNSIIPVPSGAATSVVLGGADFDTLFVAAGGKIYKRKVKPKGAPSFLPPVKPAAPRL